MSMIVGFDMDMTLLDTRPGIAATFRALTAATGVYVDADLAVSRLGPPLAHEMANWFPPARLDEAIATYRSLYRRHAIAASAPLPGAAEAMAAVRDAGGLVAVITAKHEPLALLHLEYTGLAADLVVGDTFAEGKAEALRSLGAAVYVGDHVADMRAAESAGVTAVGVTTGPCAAAELWAAGADVVLASLVEFPSSWARAVTTDVGRAIG